MTENKPAEHYHVEISEPDILTKLNTIDCRLPAVALAANNYLLDALNQALVEIKAIVKEAQSEIIRLRMENKRLRGEL